jgi:hypothetical protein
MTQKSVGFGNFPILQKIANVGRRNAHTVQFTVRHHGTGNAGLFACTAELFRISRAFVTEAEIPSADQAGRALFQQHGEEILPGRFHQRPVERQGFHMLHSVAAEQLLPVSGSIDQWGRFPGHQSVRVADKGHHTGLGAKVPGHFPACIQQCLMAQMHPVEKPKGKDFFLIHSIYW